MTSNHDQQIFLRIAIVINDCFLIGGAPGIRTPEVEVSGSIDGRKAFESWPKMTPLLLDQIFTNLEENLRGIDIYMYLKNMISYSLSNFPTLIGGILCMHKYDVSAKKFKSK